MKGHEIIKIETKHIEHVTNQKMEVNSDLIIKDWDQRQIPRFKGSPPSERFLTVIKGLNELLKHSGQLTYVNLRQEISLGKNDTLFLLERYDILSKKLKEFKYREELEEPLTQVFNRKILEKRKSKLSYDLSYESMSLYPDYQHKLEVLQNMKYIDQHNKVVLKGRVACEMGSNELIITEVIFRNILKDLEPAEIAALLSCLVFQAKTNVTPELTITLEKGMQEIIEIDHEVTKIEHMVSHCICESDTSEKLNFGLVQVVYEWAKEKPFADIMKLTDVQEGIIVRCIQQLYETIRDVKDAAKIIGDPSLGQKMEDASQSIKRDIVFAASLYTQDVD